MYDESPIRTALDPRAKELIALLSASTRSHIGRDARQTRRQHRASRQPLTWHSELVGEAVDLPIDEPGVPKLRLFRPLEARPRQSLQTLLYLHGGGWTLGDLNVYEPLCRKLANILPANIIWVEYRLAPEHPFPAPLDDTLAAISYVFRNTATLGIDATRIGVAGDSAGANLAAVSALINRDGALGGRLSSQVLIYPCLDLTASHASHREFAEGYLLTRSTYQWYLQNYLDGADPGDWRLSPLKAPHFEGLPPTVILHAGYDPLRDEAIAFAAKLRGAGVRVRELSFPELFHGFITMGAVLPQPLSALLEIRLALMAFRAS
jgi:acetyl esterase